MSMSMSTRKARKTKMLRASVLLPPAIRKVMVRATKRHKMKLSGLIRCAVEHWVDLELQELADEKRERARTHKNKPVCRA